MNKATEEFNAWSGTESDCSGQQINVDTVYQKQMFHVQMRNIFTVFIKQSCEADSLLLGAL